MFSSSPPSYVTESPSAVPSTGSSNNNGQLPAYSTSPLTGRVSAPEPRPQVEHIYELTNSKGAWATLRVFSFARQGKHMPLFLEGDAIGGMFSLNLDKDDHIMAITILVSIHPLDRSPGCS